MAAAVVVVLAGVVGLLLSGGDVAQGGPLTISPAASSPGTDTTSFPAATHAGQMAIWSQATVSLHSSGSVTIERIEAIPSGNNTAGRVVETGVNLLYPFHITPIGFPRFPAFVRQLPYRYSNASFARQVPSQWRGSSQAPPTLQIDIRFKWAGGRAAEQKWNGVDVFYRANGQQYVVKASGRVVWCWQQGCPV